MFKRAPVALLAVLLAACATGGDRPRAGASPAILVPELRAEPAEFDLAGRRETEVVYSLRNTSRGVVHLRFPTAQHLEVVLRSPDGQPLFLWSEDRAFAAGPTTVVVNPGERLEYRAALPVRDMLAGRVYSAEAVLPGYPETAARVTLRPR